jgi:two-component system, LytTR family, sensor histidine kinase AlgZ
MFNTNADKPQFLPDFGSFSMMIRFVVLAELIAVIITIGRNTDFNDQAWQDFSLLSLFAVSIALCSLVVLKLAMPLFRRTSTATGSVLAVTLLLLVTAICTDGVIYLLYNLGLISERWPAWRETFMIRSLMISGIIGTLGIRYLILQERADADSRLQQEAKMQALQSRIRPHFLFNSLNSVASLTRSDPSKAEAVLHDLADLFRVLLADARKLVPVSAEREISRQYLEVEKIRLGDRLQVKWNVSNIPRAALMPALTLQPLLENAIYHGIEPRFAGGTIKIEMWAEGETLNVMISNPLPDVRKESHGKGNKLAQENIRQRLTTQFGLAASMQVIQEGGQYHVKVKMPIIRG